MAEFNANKSKNKNQFAARLVSKKTGAMVSWVHITDEFSRKVFGVANVAEVTAVQAIATLPSLLENTFVECAITDLTAQLDPVSATDY